MISRGCGLASLPEFVFLSRKQTAGRGRCPAAIIAGWPAMDPRRQLPEGGCVLSGFRASLAKRLAIRFEGEPP
jgi:hypothetical protein